MIADEYGKGGRLRFFEPEPNPKATTTQAPAFSVLIRDHPRLRKVFFFPITSMGGRA
jgi:hypothetical protein